MKAIVTGSFDPITLGHMEIIKYASEKYDKVYVVALVNETKEYMFTMAQKKRLIELAVSDYDNVIADAYSGMTADYMHKHGITQIVRGVRNEQDVKYEKDLAEKMKAFDSEFETEIVVCEEQFAEISSTEIRNRLKNNVSIKGLLPESILSEVIDIYKANTH
ncbi:MAG: pantetheine-phosphate adenylyltransferase [Ruminococcaceae bacterium]|nr:pantetheine-phosphate adenylyltransferase [Oscillospiraceae bacterium]